MALAFVQVLFAISSAFYVSFAAFGLFVIYRTIRQNTRHRYFALLFAGLAGYAIFSILQLPLILSSRWWVYVFLEVPRDMVKMALPGIANLQTVLSLVASSIAVTSNVGFFAALHALSRRIMRGA
jgi:hypothetical protein